MCVYTFLLLPQGSCSAPVPVGAAQFFAQGQALWSLVDCDGSAQASARPSCSDMDSQPATSDNSGAHREVSNDDGRYGFSRASSTPNGCGKRSHASMQQDGDMIKPSAAAALPNGVHKAVVSSLSHANGQLTAGQSQGAARQHISDSESEDASKMPRQLLGLYPNAAAAAEPHLPGVGPLLPAWRSLAEAMAPVFHPVRHWLSCLYPHHCMFRFSASYRQQLCQCLHIRSSCFRILNDDIITVCGIGTLAALQGSAEFGLRMAALLHGPDGSGRATAAAAAAAALGIHLVAYSCLELKVVPGLLQ